jgi:hypothetical protein
MRYAYLLLIVLAAAPLALLPLGCGSTSHALPPITVSHPANLTPGELHATAAANAATGQEIQSEAPPDIGAPGDDGDELQHGRVW